MTYATPTDLVERFGAKEIAQRADRGTPRQVTDALMEAAAAGASLAAYTAGQQAAAARAMVVVNRALADAQDTINTHISSRYPLPIAPVPPVLGRIACNLARRYLYDDQVTDAIRAAYDDDMRLLRDVQGGKAGLGADALTNAQPPSNADVQLISSATVWGRDVSKDFV